MGFLITGAKIIVVIIFLALAALYFLQHKLVFFPTSIDDSYKFQYSIRFEEKFIKYGEGKVVHGILFYPGNPKVRILYFHGNGGALDSWGELGAELAQRLNAEVLMMDYPGYGKSGKDVPFSEAGLLTSGQAAFEEMKKTQNANLPLIIFGRSLGTGIASYIAANNSVSALILETPYLSTKAMADVMFPFVPSFLLRYKLDNAANLAKVNVPVLILHGTSDMVVPYDQGKKLAELNPKAQMISFPQGGHNDLSVFPDYWKSVEVFVSGVHH
jgi:pimeloyl-ACP methyl ester carboxylesterase